ncbi:Glycerophosphocholine phosphodiesterase, partial [Linderina macrospora]
MEQLENTLQCLIRYGWLIEREWNVYVRASTPGSDNPRRSSRNSVFPTNYLRSLGPWHMALSGAIARARLRANDISYGNTQPADHGISWRNFGSVVFAPSPTHWSSSYVVERAKLERTKGKKLDSWLESVPPVASPKPGQRSCTQTSDICRRNPLHYAAIAPADLLWLKRINYLDRQDVRPQNEATRLPQLAASDILGHTPLTLAARSGNVGAVKYIIEESGIDAACDSLVDAAALASAGKHTECLATIVDRMMQFPDKLSLALRLATFYGFLPLLDLVCTKLAEADAATRATVEEELGRDLSRSGECSLFHLAVFNDKTDVIRHLLSNNAGSVSAVFKASAANNGGLTPLDISNYLGFVDCAAVLIGATAPASADLANAGEQIPVIAAAQGGPGAPPETHAIFVTLGTNDMRRFPSMPPITFDTEALNSLLDENDLPRSTHLLLRVDSEQGMEKNNENGWVVDVDAMLSDPASASAGAWQPFAHFYTVYPDRFVLKLELIALIDQALLPYSSDQKVIAHSAVTVPPSCSLDDVKATAGQTAHKRVTNSSGYMHVLLLSTTSSAIVGEAHLEVLVATPYSHPNFDRDSVPLRPPASSRKQNSMRDSKSRSVGSGSGSGSSSGSSRADSDGDDLASRRAVASRRDSMSDDVSDGSPSWRQDGATLIYGHRGSGKNFTPADNAFNLQLGENTVLSMQQAVRDGAAAVEFDVQLTRDMVPVIYHDWNVSETGLDVPVNSLTLKQFMSFSPQNRLSTRTCSHGNLSHIRQSAAPLANSNSTVRTPFATLEQLFESLPE